jgi:acetyl-CoA carboxylase biotin carboxyl carrier protein
LNGKQPKKNATGGSPGGSTGGSSNSRGQSGPMDVDLLEQLVKLMAVNDLNTVDVRDGEKRIILKRGATGTVAVPVASTAVAHTVPVAATPLPAATPSQANPDADLKPIKSPMVGTYYSKPSPDSKPFVTVGSTVNEESDVCIIEAMKTFNNIKAGVRGTIARILVQDGEVVQYDTVLFLVKPS